ncbi:A disintegrin and metalloproteinase with thrombospondin motifs 7 [Elysia marginata]|uniref:A disintegrin and metalloproteinase with thrombospondin motifs 7 n=1 Tax=Elysia marginata TaxID=1093978 RepID=A0AAV4HHX0_9GAST|nr:A disintegrin and metalloproteinase with thrombospondin motifs 7 [Elysia marginata]
MTGSAYPIADDDDGNIFLEEGDEKVESKFGNDDDIGDDQADDAVSTSSPSTPPEKHGHYKESENEDDGEMYTTQSNILKEVDEGGDNENGEIGKEERTTITNVIETTENHRVSKVVRFVWKTLEWGKCSRSCGEGVKTRETICVREKDGIQAEPTECDVSSKPISLMECVGTTCLRWQADAWSECSTSCGYGVQTRDVVCPDQDSCDASLRPDTTRECLDQPPCTTWVHGDWSKVIS